MTEIFFDDDNDGFNDNYDDNNDNDIRAMPERKRFFSIDVFPYSPLYRASMSPPSPELYTC